MPFFGGEIDAPQDLPIEYRLAPEVSFYTRDAV